MIESIRLTKAASFGDQPTIMSALAAFNFVYGANGSGKTTIGRVIAGEAGFPACNVAWRAGVPLETMVYNRDFVARNFGPSIDLKGIFTLGEENVETQAKIAEAKAKVDAFEEDIKTLNRTLGGEDGDGGKRGELTALETECKEFCWAQKHKHDETLKGAFEGVRASSERFKQRVMHERSNNAATLIDITDLQARAATVYGDTPERAPLLATLTVQPLVAHESDPILQTAVIGKEDVDIAAMIKALGNSDWVKQGLPYFESNHKETCPFCQQETPAHLEKSLNAYFDQAFLESSQAIDALIVAYEMDAARLDREIANIAAAPGKFLDVETFKAEKDLLDARVLINTLSLAQKKREPSRLMALESVQPIVERLVALINDANLKATDHNVVVGNLAHERTRLTGEVWRYLLDVELVQSLASYDDRKKALNSAIDSLEKKIDAARKNRDATAGEIKELERSTTSILPTINAINALLGSFGFRGFSLAAAKKDRCYVLQRPDGTDAAETLSEGERSFVTFLYFFHLLKGSESETGTTADRVVVFDDPVSSLDSDILYIVSTLIKSVIAEASAGISRIKQVFVLTHNVYFHKEVTFLKNRSKDEVKSNETFWVIRKKDLLSSLDSHKTNPIKTSYELLWHEVRRENPSPATVQNTLRRILESYFKILGKVNPDKLCDTFEGRDKQVCKSLLSWANDGSHSAHDDLYVALDVSQVDRYLCVFRKIFENSNHGAHYEMMMGDDFVPEVVRAITPDIRA